ncbi:hypothetical protein GC163_03495 [bacterium]|nr:hypothetical protein [bacterium]
MKQLSRLQAIVVTVLVLGSASVFAVEAKALAGKYTVTGKNPAGNEFSGTAEITHKKGPTVEIVWKIGKRTTVGFGKLVGDTLTVEYQGAVADREGKAIYEVKPRGKIIGKWHTKGVPGVGTETMTPE